MTLDACNGGFDHRLLSLLIERRVPATLFVTKRWMDGHADALRLILQHPDLFELENHGTHHRPLVLGAQQHLYGMAGHPDMASLQAEITGAVEPLRALTGRAPRYFRGAGAAYDTAGQQAVQALGYQIAGFSVNADAGASFPAAMVAARLLTVREGDVVIAHINHPAGGTAEGFARALPQLQSRGLRFVKLSQTTLMPVLGLR